MAEKLKAKKNAHNKVLSPIPDRLYFSIGETSRLCHLEPHVLRYWEQEFSQLQPVKRRGNRRYYRREDVILVRHIRELLYVKGFTIEGARAQLKTEGRSVSKIIKTSNEDLLHSLTNVLKVLESNEIAA